MYRLVTMNPLLVSLLLFSLTMGMNTWAPQSSLFVVKDEERPLSSELLQQMLALSGESGLDGQIPAYLADELGFTVNNQPWPYHQISAKEDESDSSSPLHAFGVSRGAGQDLLIYLWSNGVHYFMGIHRDGKVVKAVSEDRSAGKSNFMDGVSAQRMVDSEIQFWQRNAEKTRYWWRCAGETSGPHPVDKKVKIDACTWVIHSEQQPGKLALAYMFRAESYDHDESQKELDDYNQATKVDPSNALAWAELCNAQNWVAKDSRTALQSCSKALQLNPHLVQAWTFRGDIHLRNNEFDDAISDYDHAIKLGSTWMWPLDNRGEAYLRKNQIDRAIMDFNEVIRVSPDYSAGYLDRGIAEMRKNELDSALADFQTALQVNAKCNECLLGLGLAERAKGNQQAGDADVAKAKAADPNATEQFIKDGIQIP